METLWFMIVAVMVAAYVVLDGFDLGAGAIYLAAAKTPAERRTIMRAIGPVWDGNEVWLLAAGGTLYFAFPLLYASSFSGFYLPLMMVLWLLMLRGIGIELGSHMENPVWRGFFDVIFSVSSVLLCIFFGAALGNVVRGVPLGRRRILLRTALDQLPRELTVLARSNGILDWYTVLCGVIALVTLTAHGSLYVATKTEDDLNRRARTTAKWAWPLATSSYCRRTDRNRLDPSRRARQLQATRHRIRHSCARLRLARRHDARHDQARRQDCVCGFGTLYRRHARRSGIRTLSRCAARQHRSTPQPDHLTTPPPASTASPSDSCGGFRG